MTGVVSRWSAKTNKPFGFVTIEDFEGAGELALFNDEWVKWQHMFKEGYTVYVTAKCVQRFRDNADILDIRIQSVDFLSDVKDKYIEKLTIAVNTSVLDETQMNDLATVVKNNPGRIPLYFQVYDAERKRDVLLASRGNEVDVNASLISYIESCPALTYMLN